MSTVSGIYGQDYFEKYAALAQTPLGVAIYAARWALITRFCPSPTSNGRLSVLDYGSGPGSFNAHGPDSYVKHNFDINPVCGFTERVWECKAGFGHDELHRCSKLDVLTMWDSIEHIPNFFDEIKQINAPWLFITTPNLESVHKSVIHWKHYRPREHIFYFDRHSLGVILEALGYDIVEMNHDEGRLRDPQHPDAIITVVARKRA